MSVDESWRMRADPDLVADWSAAQLGSVLVHHVCHLLRTHAERAQAAGVGPDNAQDWVRAADAAVLTARLSGHQVMINGHALSPPLSFVAAIPVGPEPRSRWSARSEARTTDWTVGGRLTRPPRSRNVADRRAPAAHVPAAMSGSLGLPGRRLCRPEQGHLRAC